MNNNDNPFHLLAGFMKDSLWNEGKETSSVFTEDEECIYGDEVYFSMEECITYYRSYEVSRGIPQDVSSRLHSVIKKQWMIKQVITEQGKGSIEDGNTH